MTHAQVGFDLPSLLGFTHHNVGAVARSVAMATVLWLTGVIMIMNVFPLVFGSDVVMMGESVDPGGTHSIVAGEQCMISYPNCNTVA